MIFKNHFKIGDKVKVGIHVNSKDVKFYESKILDIMLEDEIIKLYNISDHGKDINIENRGNITILKENNPLIFMFNTRIVDFKDDSHIKGLTLKLPQDVERMQRRDFYRLPINIKISLKKEGEPNIYLGETIDLSGSGLSVDLDTKLEIDDDVIIDLPLTDDLYLENVYGKISWIKKGVLLPYRYGIKFTNKKEELISYIFQIQRMRMKIANEL